MGSAQHRAAVSMNVRVEKGFDLSGCSEEPRAGRPEFSYRDLCK